MDPFLMRFFPSMYRKMKAYQNQNQYCKFDSQRLTTFTSSLYLAGFIASFFASTVTRTFGRKPSMVFGGLSFLVGAAVNGAAQSVAMLIIGRILLGVGVGFAGQVNIDRFFSFLHILLSDIHIISEKILSYFRFL